MLRLPLSTAIRLAALPPAAISTVRFFAVLLVLQLRGNFHWVAIQTPDINVSSKCGLVTSQFNPR